MEIVVLPTTGWKKLDGIIGQFVKMINERTMIKGNGILLTELPTGVIIAIDPKTLSDLVKQIIGSGQTSTENWRQMIVIDSTDCSQKYIWYWGTAPSASQGSPPTTQPVSATPTPSS